MAMQTFALSAARIGKFKGQILAHAIPVEVLTKVGRQVRMPKNNSDTYVARRWLPYGATSTDKNTQNRFFSDGTGNRVNALTQKHLTEEGVTPAPDNITPVDVTEVIQQYACLYGFTDKTYDLYEDDIPKEMIKQVAERATLVREMVVYGKLQSSTNSYYGGGGTTIATVAGVLTLNLIRKIARNLQANHGMMMNKVLAAGPNFGTEPVAAGYNVYAHTDAEQDIRDMPGFIPAEKYASGTPMPNEIGKVERFRFITSPDLVSQQDAGAAVGSTGCYSTSGTDIDVYPVIVLAEDAFSQIALRGKESLNPTYLPPSQKSKSDPFGQRGYAGTIWWQAVMLENQGWMAVAYVGVSALS